MAGAAAALEALRDVHSLTREDIRMSRIRGRQRGWIRRENGIWKLTYRVYQRTPDGEWSDSKQTVDLGDGSMTLKQANAAAKPFLDRANRVAEKPSIRMSVADFIDQQFARRANTHHYRYLIENFIRPALGLKQLCDVRPIDCQAIIDRAGKKYSSQTLKHIKGALRAIFNRAIDLEVFDGRNPAAKLDLPEVYAEKRPTYTVEQLGQVLVLLESPVYEMALLGAACSLGPSELCGLRVRHCNLTGEAVERDGEILAPYSLAIREGWYDGERTHLKAKARRRNIGITADLAEAVAAVIARNKMQGPEAPVFQSRAGTPLNTKNIERRQFKVLEERLGFSVTWYAFRRSHSTLAALTGANLQDRALVMGHSDDRMTRFYDVLSVERMRQVPANILERVHEQEAKAREEGKFGRVWEEGGIVSAYYNEHDPQKAAWLRDLIRAGAITDGDVDERSIADVRPDDLRGYERCHFFAGVGAWDYALDLAGWSGPVWTGSCPCPSFSAAGKGQGFDDPRHLWPHWYRLIRESRPPVCFGEQVDAAIGHGWLDLVSTDLENEAYSIGAAVLGACSVGAPHRRQRLYFVGHANGARREARHIERIRTGSRSAESAESTSSLDLEHAFARRTRSLPECATVAELRTR